MPPAVLYRCCLLARVAPDRPGLGDTGQERGKETERKKVAALRDSQSSTESSFSLFLDTVSIICGAVINGGTVLSLFSSFIWYFFHSPVLVFLSSLTACASGGHCVQLLLPPFVTLIGLNSQSSTRSVLLVVLVLVLLLCVHSDCPLQCQPPLPLATVH